MKVTLIVPASSKAVVKTSAKGKEYGQQHVGVLLPGEEFAISRSIFREVRNGVADSLAPGRYDADAEVVVENNEIVVKPDGRSVRSAAPAK